MSEHDPDAEERDPGEPEFGNSAALGFDDPDALEDDEDEDTDDDDA